MRMRNLLAVIEGSRVEHMAEKRSLELLLPPQGAG